MHAGWPLMRRAQRRSATSATNGATSQAAQALLTQNGAFGVVQSLSDAQATQRPLSTSQTGVPARCAQ
jgi:hypothetical protein